MWMALGDIEIKKNNSCSNRAYSQVKEIEK